jgi:hypothetical protein
MRLTGQAMGYKMAINTHTSLRCVVIVRVTTIKHTNTHTHTRTQQDRIPDEIGADEEAVART